MKKILLLLILVPLMAISQTIPADATALENLQITNNTTSPTAPFVTVQETNGVMNKINKADLVNVVEVNDVPALPLTGETGKIYLVKNVNKIYSWNGTFYQELAVTDISGKLDKNTPITAATKTKITYDAKGLVTAGGDLLASDIPTIEQSQVANLTTDLATKVDKIAGKELSTEDYTTAEKTKLSGIQAGATANSTDAQLRDRTTHTGTQAISTVAGLQTALDSKQATLVSGTNIKTIENQALLGSGNIDLTKADVGLANVDNTSDVAKPVSTATQTALNLKINTAEKGAVNGVATLGSDGKIPNNQIPALAISETFPVSSQAAMLALTAADQGDVAIRSDINKSFILRVSPSSVLANWSELLSPTDAVSSVNGQVGVVTLTTTNIAEGSNLYYTEARVSANPSVVANTAKTSNATHTGDATGSTALTLATVNTNVGTFGNASNTTTQTVNAKGLTTAIANVSIQIAESQVTGLVTDLANKEPIIPIKNTAFNKNFGTTAGTVAEGNDSRFTDSRNPLPNSSNYIQNQGTSAQSANMWISGSIKNSYIDISNNQLNEFITDTDNAQIAINFNGFNGGTTRFRNFAIYNGKNSPIFSLVGSTGAATFASTIIASPATVDTQLATLGQVNLKEPIISTKNTAFNKNFGTTAGTVVEGGTLGANAYSSTPYLPLSGGTLTGNLNGTSATFNSSVTASIFKTVGTSNFSIFKATSYGGEFYFGIDDSVGGSLLNSGQSSPYARVINTNSSYPLILAVGNNATLKMVNGGAATFSSTVTASPATVDTELATLGQAKAAARPYKVYTALLSQSGTNAPVATVLENTMNTYTWVRSGVGTYYLNYGTDYDSNKIHVIVSQNSGSKFYYASSDNTLFNLGAVNRSTGAAEDNFGINKVSIEIRVYN